MLNLAFIWHMHQPYYKDLITGEFHLPWARLHATKDYLDMLKILENFPKIKQVFNLVPSLIEQLEDYAKGEAKDHFLELSYKRPRDLNNEERNFVLEHFFMVDPNRVISNFPRYLELFYKRKTGLEFSDQDILDLQVLFNLAWIDPYFRKTRDDLKSLVLRGRFFSQEEKLIVLNSQIDIIRQIIPTYQEFLRKGRIEITVTPFYHPILPLLYNTKIAKESNPRATLPKKNFNFPQDALWHIKEAVACYKNYFGSQNNLGMWPSEEAVSEHIVKFFIEQNINWIISDEAILFRSLNKRRTAEALYQPYKLQREGGELNIIFRDRNLSDLIGFVYQRWDEKQAVDDFIKHLDNIIKHFKGKDCLVTIAMDGENAWEYYKNDGWDFLSLLYERLSNHPEIKTVTISEYLKERPAQINIKKLASGSWIHGNFNKWIGQGDKTLFWQYLLEAREILDKENITDELAWRQIHVLEGSDWFWWAAEGHPQFDQLFKKHLANFYNIIRHPLPEYLKSQ